ncbi:MAG TPA: flagellar basal body L-ring protein FlgH [Burkholderiales bacterium]|nr:flagellar basal body L-ring protein FlgH [Burkholderiales bacterium]
MRSGPQHLQITPSVHLLTRLALLGLFAIAPHLPGSRSVRLPLAALALALFAGCAWNTQPTTVHQPMTARPGPQQERVVNPGAVYQPDLARVVLFEDRRARFVGDTLTVVIEEKTTASKKSSGNASRTSSIEAGVPKVAGIPGANLLKKLDIEASTSNKFEGKGDAASNNLFNGNLAVTVIEVLENGNLLVSGEKQVTINRGTEFIRFSGVVNPINITPSNTVSSTRVADARIEYRGTGYVSESQNMGWLSRFFLTVAPF